CSITSDTVRTLATARSIVPAACSTCFTPSPTPEADSPISAFTSFAASALLCASALTSAATTAKPRPCSPARAASTAALSARMLVWKAMLSITPMMSSILRLDAEIVCIVATTLPTTSPPCVATVRAEAASCAASCAVSALLRTVLESCSIEEAVCCRLEACCSVRSDRSALPVAIWPEPVAMACEVSRTCVTTCARLSRMRCIAAITLIESPRVSGTATARGVEHLAGERDEALGRLVLRAEQLGFEPIRRVGLPVVDARGVFLLEPLGFGARFGGGHRAFDRLRQHEPQLDQVQRRR